MKKIILFVLIFVSCGKNAGDQKCDFVNGHQLYLGPQGGCYYNNSNGNKEYVDRAMCQNCK